MKKVLGILLIIVGVVSGLYFALWWAFIGGIIDVIAEVRAPNINALNVAVGVAKIFFAGAIYWMVALPLVIPGYFMVANKGE